MHYEIEMTTNYRFQFRKLSLQMKRFVEEAIDILKLSPTECQGKIVKLSTSLRNAAPGEAVGGQSGQSNQSGDKDQNLYRFRIPGAFIIYIVDSNEEAPKVILTQIKVLR